MAEEADGEDRTEEASARKLQQAREKGDVAKSGDLPQALSLIGACAVVAIAGPTLARGLVGDLVPFLAHPQQLLGSLEGDGGVTILKELVFGILPILAVVMGVTLLFGVGGHVMQTGLMFTTEKMKPSLEKLNPMSGFKRLFGFDALIQFAKTVVKLIITGAIVWSVLKGKLYEILALAKASPLLILPYAMDVFIALAMAVCIFLFIEGAGDYMWQRFRFMQRMKMSKQEQKEEYKQMEGDPHVKAKLRQIRIEKSRRRMMSNVKDATVVITNPTHYAVALQFEMGQMQAPLCVAKGVDTLALKIREEAGKHNVPIVEDVPLARALYAAIDIDETIPEEHFAAVAKVISFVLAKKRRGF
ncbi:flagellar biosynthesis protein FlhB [Asticcacaulis sp. AC460]|uniref:flagellar biosynthesis protein FlhB n=1 Tax=Asticcacaulis sp. AC460 TaxID=1282360 RepID=UPI0003C3EB59|nr:flagellar biosynthesis protein FlhB [Asticcacaulis sp. AC460]ESQ87310.1 flagellar biosynthesis protein FlhB [Asticcacaulis sp. AC460]